GVRYYVPMENHDRWFEKQIPPIWISAGGKEKLRPLPPLKEKVTSPDPYTGEPVTVELYEESVSIEEIHEWPVASDPAAVPRFYPTVVLKVNEAEGFFLIDLQIYPHGDSTMTGYPFFTPPYDPDAAMEYPPARRLVSRPDKSVIRLKVPLAEASKLGLKNLLKRGLVYSGRFEEGKLVRLSIGGDYWSEIAPVSRLGAPLFALGEKMSFQFPATRIEGAATSISLTPDSITGVDFNNYDFLATMGPPYGDMSTPIELQDSWAVDIEGSLKLVVIAPLMEGRGAGGMLELESISLEPVVPGLSEPEFSAGDLKAFREVLPASFDLGNLPEGWKSILQEKLGQVPEGQRTPETDYTGF
ncbi:MAG: hypothetical protein AAF733_08565, partial [Verrucomicrobiota bacterium]